MVATNESDSCSVIKAIDCATNREVMASATLPHYSEGGQYSCKYCNKSVNIRHGRIKSPHFYHLHTGSCLANIGDTRDETHFRLQELVCEILGLPREAMEVRIGDNIADIVWRKEDHGLDLPDIVIEIQRSPISLEVKERREKNYKEHGYEVIWIFQAGSQENKPVRRGYFREYNPEKQIYKLSRCEMTPTNTALYITAKEPFSLFTVQFVHALKSSTRFYLASSCEIHDKGQCLQYVTGCFLKPASSTPCVPNFSLQMPPDSKRSLPPPLSPFVNVNQLTPHQVKLYMDWYAPGIHISEDILIPPLEEGKRLKWNIRMLALRLQYVARHPKETLLVQTVITK